MSEEKKKLIHFKGSAANQGGPLKEGEKATPTSKYDDGEKEKPKDTPKA